MPYVTHFTEESDTIPSELLFKYFENRNRYIERRTIDLYTIIFPCQWLFDLFDLYFVLFIVESYINYKETG